MVVSVCLHGYWWLLVAAALKQWQRSSCGDGRPVWAGSWEGRRRRNWAGRYKSMSIRTRAFHLWDSWSVLQRMSRFTAERWRSTQCTIAFSSYYNRDIVDDTILHLNVLQHVGTLLQQHLGNPFQDMFFLPRNLGMVVLILGNPRQLGIN